MNISPVNNAADYKPAFKAVIVKKIEPVLKQRGITFYNNGTAKLKNPCNLFEGASLLIRNIIQNNKKRIDTILDVFDLSRLDNMIKYLPRQIFENRILEGVVGAGLNITALQLNKNQVLCLSNNIEIFDERPFEDFDLPIKMRGKYNHPEAEKAGWFVRDLAQPINKHELERLGRMITNKGYALYDWRTEQGCKFEDRLYLLDFECAQSEEQQMRNFMNNYG